MPSRLESTLKRIFSQQAQEILSQAPRLLRAGGRVSLAHWHNPMTQAVVPFLLHASHVGIAEQARTLSAKYKTKYTGLDMRSIRPKAEANAQQWASLAVRESNDTASSRLNDKLVLIRRELRRKDGITPRQANLLLKREVRDIIKDSHRVDIFAITETYRATQQGQNLVREQSGLVKRLQWVANYGPTCCKQCRKLNGKKVKLGEPFWVDPRGGPYATVYGPPIHPFCYCAVKDIN